MPRDKALCMSQYAGKEGKGLMKQTVLKTTVAVLGAGLVSYLGTLAVPMLVLLGVMLLDYITGMIKAYIRAELNSKFGIKGILKKLCYMVMVAVGAAVDYLLRGAVIGAGITLDVKLFSACSSPCGLRSTSSFPSWKILRPSACRGFRVCSAF